MRSLDGVLLNTLGISYGHILRKVSVLFQLWIGRITVNLEFVFHSPLLLSMPQS